MKWVNVISIKRKFLFVPMLFLVGMFFSDCKEPEVFTEFEMLDFDTTLTEGYSGFVCDMGIKHTKYVTYLIHNVGPNILSIDKNTGIVTVAHRDHLDYEKDSTADAIVTAFVGDENYEAKISVKVLNRPDYFKLYSDTILVNENVPKGTVIGRVRAFSDISAITYSLSSYFKILSINKNNGDLIVEDEDFFNYERNKQVLFNVRANDAKFFDDKDILVKVVDLPDSYSIRERLDTGAKVFELLANMEYKKEEFYGVYYKGGYIFYIDKVKKELMVANIYSYFQYTSVFIDRYSTYLNITDESIGAGKENTDMIAANDISTSAAARCKFLSSGNSNGYNDWFLPSVQEMQELNKNLYGKGFNLKENKPYWTSNCTGYSNASGVNYDGIGEEIALKRADEHYFVPVRSFIE